jgi:hypothetical protein
MSAQRLAISPWQGTNNQVAQGLVIPSNRGTGPRQRNTGLQECNRANNQHPRPEWSEKCR